MNTSLSMTLDEAVEAAKAGQRFQERLDKFVPDRPEDGCWLWVGSHTKQGYGNLTWGGRCGIRAHRWTYEHLVGPIPDGLLLRHTCDVKDCVNPAHLIPGTHAENKQDAVERGLAHGGNTYKTECINKHPFDEQNTYITAEGYRRCRTCHRLRAQERRAARIAA